MIYTVSTAFWTSPGNAETRATGFSNTVEWFLGPRDEDHFPRSGRRLMMCEPPSAPLGSTADVEPSTTCLPLIETPCCWWRVAWARAATRGCTATPACSRVESGDRSLASPGAFNFQFEAECGIIGGILQCTLCMVSSINTASLTGACSGVWA